MNPKVSHFRIFGCPVYTHVPIEKRTKLEPSNGKGLFVGYSETSTAYRIYIPEHKKTILSRDVKFKDDFASRKAHEPTPMAEDEEQKALKVEWGSPVISKAVHQPSSEQGETRTPSTSIKRP
jgi:hypothetical protein